MKKIDLHIHTIPTINDGHFEFNINILKKYVESRGIDGVAITNHNYFDLSQFQEISDSVPITVLPGIEIDLEGGHILLVADRNELTDFDTRCKDVSAQVKTRDDSISVSELLTIFPDLSKYILIPHYNKKPLIREEILIKLEKFVTAGEVTSPKKFKYCLNNTESLVPVYFSDIRIKNDLTTFPTRQTYIDAQDTNFGTIKMCLLDKNKVFLSKEDGHRFFEALDNGLRLSSGLNVVLGERSSGKTYTLGRISESFENVKYIKQFSLLERDEESDAKRFYNLLSKRQSLFTQEYLQEFQGVVDSMASIDLEKNERSVEQYLSSLIQNAKESERADLYSKARLFSEVDFPESDSESLKTLIKSVTTLIENTEYRTLIDQHVSVEALKKLAVELMKKYAEETEANLKKRWANDLVGTIRKSLQVHTAATVIKDIDLYLIAMEKKKVEKFREVVDAARKEKQIFKKDVQGFQIVAKIRAFRGAQELKNLSGKMLTFSGAYQSYDDPYSYLKKLRKIVGLEEAEYFRYFANVEYKILNRYGTDVSGGERSEFRLLQEIIDAQQYDMLLIDEPESSFDNLFLKSNVNKLIKDISKSVPIVIVTHNNTVGASIQPDYVIYTNKKIVGDKIEYKIYSGYPTDKNLTGLDGQKIKNLDILLDCLEAGQKTYDERGNSYETLKN